jgi:LSD1 subclass zinc finger protein
VAVPKIFQAKCPTCGANLPVPPGAPQIMCRYCQNVIHVEHRKPPPEVRPFGSPGAMPSRTLYVDPEAAARASKHVGLLILVGVAIPILLPLLIGVLPWAIRSCKSKIRPFPVACGLNEELTVSGNYESTGPIVTSVGHNCKLHIKNAKLKGSTLVKADTFNMELSLENVTIETTEPMIHSGSNLKVKVIGSTLTSATTVFDSDSNMEIDVNG